MSCYHIAVFIFIKKATKLVKPLDSVGSLHNKASEKLRSCGKMSAAESVEIVLNGRIVGFIRCLNTAFRHHCVRVTDAQLCCNDNSCAGSVCLNGGGSSGTACSDYQNIRIKINF